MTRFRFVNGHVATSGGVLPGAEIVVDGDRIASIGAVEGSADTIDLNGGWVVPGYIDTQVNGGGGVLFNDRLDVEGIATMAAAHAAYGTTAMLPTLVSETPDKIARALDAIDEAMAFAAPHETLQVRPSRGGVCVYVLVSLPRACRAPLAVSSV